MPPTLLPNRFNRVLLQKRHKARKAWKLAREPRTLATRFGTFVPRPPNQNAKVRTVLQSSWTKQLQNLLFCIHSESLHANHFILVGTNTFLSATTFHAHTSKIPDRFASIASFASSAQIVKRSCCVIPVMTEIVRYSSLL